MQENVTKQMAARAGGLLAVMDAMPSGIIAIDGPCASGKSTLAAYLETLYGLSVLHMDDFFLRPSQRTPERLAEPGGNVDRERFLSEVLLPLKERKDFTFRPYDCATQALAPARQFHVTPLTVVEGSYSHHPDLRDAYDLRVYIHVDPAVQQARLAARSPALLERFLTEWIPLENRYFDTFQIAEGSDIVLTL